MTARDAVPLDRPMGLVRDMPFADYLAVDALSASGLKLLARSAWHYRNRVEITQTRPMLRGSLVHCARLEPDALASRYVVVPEDAPKRPTKAQWAAAKPNASSVEAMAWWTEFNAGLQGRELVTAAEFAVTQMQLRALTAEPYIADIFSVGYGEASVFWNDPATGVYCKARPDWVRPLSTRRVRLCDLKSTVDESPSGFGRAAARLGYHLQAAHYVDGFRQATGMEVEDFVFAAVTSAPPVLAVPYILTDEIAEQAVDERAALLELYANCRREDTWPTYGTGPQLLDFPAYMKRSAEVEVSFVDD